MVGESELGTHSGDRKWLTLFVWLANFGKIPLVQKVRIFALLSAIAAVLCLSEQEKKSSFIRGHRSDYFKTIFKRY